MGIVTLAAVSGDIKFIGYGIAVLGPAIGEGMIVSKALESTARQPEAGGHLQTVMLIGLAFVEVIALLSFVLALI